MTVKQSVLAALEHARGQCISGEALARSLGVSRAAVWKAIEALRTDGLQISAVQSAGYCLSDADDSLTSAGISALLQTESFGRDLLVLPEVTSSNTLLKQDYLDRAHGFALIAEAQRAGRGRLGRTFVSPADTGLYLSLLLRPQLAPEQLNLITIAAAVAVKRAITTCCGWTPDVKWVNDIMRNGRKLAGILTEATIEGESGTVSAVIIGIGINLRPNPQWPDDVCAVAGALSDFSPPPRRATLAAALLLALEQVYADLTAGRMACLLDEYRAALCVLGKTVTVHTPQRVYPAVCRALDKHGHLVVINDAGQEITLTSGEVSIRPTADL